MTGDDANANGPDIMDAARNKESDAVHAWMVELGEIKGSANIRATGRIAADKQHERVNPNREVTNLWLVELVIVSLHHNVEGKSPATENASQLEE